MQDGCQQGRPRVAPSRLLRGTAAADRVDRRREAHRPGVRAPVLPRAATPPPRPRPGAARPPRPPRSEHPRGTMAKMMCGRRTEAIEFDDRTIAHLQTVILAKLRRDERFAFTTVGNTGTYLDSPFHRYEHGWSRPSSARFRREARDSPRHHRRSSASAPFQGAPTRRSGEASFVRCTPSCIRSEDDRIIRSTHLGSGSGRSDGGRSGRGRNAARHPSARSRLSPGSAGGRSSR